ncbi:LuxR C-terminal-related transcriptional regulator [Chloroflexota bacterium]
MQNMLLATKFHIPSTRPELVPRPRLIKQLNNNLPRKLTLISAPAGFGKTTLVSEWIASHEQPVAWLSLDVHDNDSTRFLAYMITSLRMGIGTDTFVGQTAQDLIQSPQPPSYDIVLTSLLNDLASISGRLILILDDYHVIESTQVDNALSFFLEHLPPQMHLIITTREDPQLPLARLRARDQMTELRVTDLRFTSSEAVGFLNQVMGLNLSAKDIATLKIRTEGWIVGLQLAAISLQGCQNTSNFMKSFSGSHRFVLDYLVEEVLHQQTESVQTFLLHTSILDRLTPSLCDAVLLAPTTSKQNTLNYLDNANLFVIPLDDNRQWYRYHHLFADVLQARLLEKQPAQIATLHQRASAWYEQNGLSSDAVRHSLVAEDFERVASLAELEWQTMDDSFQSTAWLDWVKKLPDDLLRTRPVLSVQYAEALIASGELETSEARLRDAERWLEPTRDMSERAAVPSSEMVVVDKEQFRTLPARIALVRAQKTLAQGDIAGMVQYAELALKLAPEEDPLRSQAIVLLGFTYWANGNLEAAHRSIADWVDSMHKIGNIYFAIASTFGLADIRVAQGRLHEAVRTYKQSLQLAAKHDKVAQRVIAHHYLGLALLYHEMGDQDATAQHLQKSRELGERTTLIDWPYRWCVAQARLKETEEDWEVVLDFLDEAKRLYVRNLVPDTHPIEALKARVYVRQDRLAKALDWVHEQGLSADDELSYLREFEHITLTRVLIAEYKSNHAERSILQANRLLEHLLQAATEDKRIGSVIEILMLQAFAHQAQGNISLALAPLERALTLAEPAGYFRIFVDEATPMATLLREAAKHGIAPHYISQLLQALEKTEGRPSANQFLSEPLSKRELEVLALLRTELNGPEIAQELLVSLNTMRTHTKNIYSKLGVNNRRAAIRRAEELDLL